MRGQLLLALALFQIQCIDYGQRQAKLSVAGVAALKQHVPPFRGQLWDTLTHLISWVQD